MKKFALKVLRLVRRVTWNFKVYPLPFDVREGGLRSGCYGLAACRWSQMGGPVRRAVWGRRPIPPEAKIELNKYYDDSLWGDGLPDSPTMRGHEYLEWHRLPVRRPPLDPRER